jgi:hypothetical protein
MRIAEIISDFRNLQHYIAQIQANPSAEEYYLPGYSLLRACIAEAQAVLTSPYAHGPNAPPGGDIETEKAQLRAYVPIFFFDHSLSSACTGREADLRFSID